MTAPLNVNAISIVPEEARLSFTETGIVEYEDQVFVYPPVAGKVLSIAVEEGQTITKGDLICQIDMSDTAFAIGEANAQIASFEAQIRNLETEQVRNRDSLNIQKNNLLKELDTLNVQENSATVTQEEQMEMQNKILEQNLADIARLENEFNTVTQILYDSGELPRVEYDAAKTAIDNVKAQYEQNLQQMEIIKAGTAQTDPAYYNASREALNEQIRGIENSLSKDYTAAMKDSYNAQIQSVRVNIERLNDSVLDSEVYSTVDGTIINLPVSKSNLASNASPLAEIAVGRSLIAVYVSTNDIDSVSIGKDVDLILRRREGDQTYKGKVVEIDDKAEIKISSLGVEERKVKVYVEPAEHKELFLIGYDVDVEFLVFSKRNALLLPKTAIFNDDGTDIVWEVKDGVLQKTPIIKGMEIHSEVIIDGGLAAGSVIISDASLEELSEGINVVAQ
jgi:HlyD family secretion protein